MINNSPNMGKTQIFNELPLPSKAGIGEGLTLIYKAIFICVKLLLDIRLNLVMISEGKKIQTKHKTFNKKKSNNGNLVIKDSDNINLEKK